MIDANIITSAMYKYNQLIVQKESTWFINDWSD